MAILRTVIGFIIGGSVGYIFGLEGVICMAIGGVWGIYCVLVPTKDI